MKTIKTWCVLLFFFGCLNMAVAQPAPVTTESTTEVKETYPDHIAIYNVLASDHSVKHGKYTMQGQNWRGEGTYTNGQKKGIWSFYSSKNSLVSQYDFTNLKQIYEREILNPYPESLVFVDSAYQKIRVDNEAKLLGGDMRLMPFLIKNINYPAAAQRARAQGLVVLAIELSETGQVIDVKVEKSVTQELDAEAMRLFGQVPNDWIPAVVDGKPVRSIFYFPVRFSVK